MSEIRELLRAFDEARSAGKRVALATVVSVDGPAYRGEGAKMLIEEGGAVTCMISGGCLEGEVAAIAQSVIASGVPGVHHFDLDEDVLWGLGIGCGGSIDVLIEPMNEEPLLQAWMEALRRARPAVLATAISDGLSQQWPRRLLVTGDEEPRGSLEDSRAQAASLELARQKLGQLHPRPQTVEIPLANGQTGKVFFDVNLPPPELVLFGAGHDAMPLAELGVKLGFEVAVADARPAFATAERFPGCRIILCQPGNLHERLQLGARSYALVMNHHLERDRICLRFALESDAPYVGVLGPLSRYERLKSALSDEGYQPDKGQEERVYSPVGLDLGAEPPEEVAVSILAEVLALHKGHSGGFLRGHKGRIHVRDASEPKARVPTAEMVR